jgi:hypothetical protein
MYVKLFSSILTSSLWAEDQATRVVWITLLAMADPEGFVRASPSGLSRIANVPPEDCRRALEVLLAPDPDSTTPDDEGRRLVPVPGGWHITNYTTYRNLQDQEVRREQWREAAKRQRAKRQGRTPDDRPDESSEVITSHHASSRVITRHPKSSQEEAEAEGEAGTTTTTTASRAKRAKGQAGDAGPAAPPRPAKKGSIADADWLQPIRHAYELRRGPGTFAPVAGRWAKAFAPLAKQFGAEECAVVVHHALRPTNPKRDILAPERIAAAFWDHHPHALVQSSDDSLMRWPDGRFIILARAPGSMTPYPVDPAWSSLGIALLRHPETGEPWLARRTNGTYTLARRATDDDIADMAGPPMEAAA